MKRLIILMMLATLWACDKPAPEDGGTENGGGSSSECVIPSTAQAGKEVILQWDGFVQGADIILVSADGKEYDMDVRGVTSSGLTFKIPSNVPAGVYKVRLVQDGTKELGQITVTAASMPVTGLKVPSGATQGDQVIIAGAGFEAGCSVKFTGSSGEEITLEASVISSGISIDIPEDMPAGAYVVYLVQDGTSWVMAENFMIYEELVMKTLVRIEYDTPYVGTAMLRYSWDISYGDPVTLTLSEYVVEGEEASLEAYDKYVCDVTLSVIELAEDGREQSNDLEMTYDRNVVSGFPDASDVLIYGDEEPTRFTWTYNSDGFLTDVSSPSRSFRVLEYSDGNLIRFRNTGFKYENPELVNHPGAADVAWGYMSMMEINDPFVYFPYLLGWYDLDSALLPSSVTVPDPEDPTGTGTVDYSFSYEFDEDGYVISMAWDTNKIGYFYE